MERRQWDLRKVIVFFTDYCRIRLTQAKSVDSRNIVN